MNAAILSKNGDHPERTAGFTLEAAALKSFAPIALALKGCDPELRDLALELFAQLDSGELDKDEEFSTVALLAEILFPEAGRRKLPGADLAEAEGDAASADPEAAKVIEEMDRQEEHFARRVAELMDERGINQSALAEAVGIGQPAVSMMLKRQARPQRRTIEKYAKALGVSPGELWPGFDAQEPADKT